MYIIFYVIELNQGESYSYGGSANNPDGDPTPKNVRFNWDFT